MENLTENCIGNTALKETAVEIGPRPEPAPSDAKYEILYDQFLPPIGSRPKLYRIRALKNIASQGVNAGDLGGWVEDASNLSQWGTCWIHDNAAVYGKSRVLDYAAVSDRAEVRDHSTIKNHGAVRDRATISNVCVKDCSKVSGQARVNDSILAGFVEINDRCRVDRSELKDDIVVANSTIISALTADGHIRIFGGNINECEIHGECTIAGNATLEFTTLNGTITVADTARVVSSDLGGQIRILDDAVVKNCCELRGDNLVIGRGAMVTDGDYLIIGPLGRGARDLLIYRAENTINYSVDGKILLGHAALIDYLDNKLGIPRKHLKKMVGSLTAMLK